MDDIGFNDVHSTHVAVVARAQSRIDVMKFRNIYSTHQNGK